MKTRRFIRTRLMVLCCLAAPLLWAHPGVAQPVAERQGPEFNSVLTNRRILTGREFDFTYIATDDDDGDLLCERGTGFPVNARLATRRRSTRTECRFRWTPGQIGQFTISVTVRNQRTNRRTTARATLTVIFDNYRPRFTQALTDQTLRAGETLSFHYQAEDYNTREGDELTYSLVNPPQGATIDSKSGHFSWQSPLTMTGQQLIEVKVEDSQGASATTSATLNFEGVAAVAPTITRAPPDEVTLTEGVPFVFVYEANDPEGDPLRFIMRNQPAGAEFNTFDGTFTWTPTANQVGERTVTVMVQDEGNLQSEEKQTRFRIVAKETAPEPEPEPNTAPVLPSIRRQTIEEGKLLSFAVEAQDANDGDVLTYSLGEAPAGAGIGRSSGQFRWTPNFEQAGDYTIYVQVSDGRLYDEVALAVEVLDVELPTNETNLGPYFVQVPVAGLEIEADTPLELRYEAEDPNGDALQYALLEGPEDADFDEATGVLSWTPREVGEYRFVVEVRDAAGATDTDEATLVVVPASGTGASTPTSKGTALLTGPWWLYVGGGVVLLGSIVGLIFLVRTRRWRDPALAPHPEAALEPPPTDEPQDDIALPSHEEDDGMLFIDEPDASYSPIALPPNTLLDNQYTIKHMLGHPGGFGLTYLAWDNRLETYVAIKEYMPRMLAGRVAHSLSVMPHSTRDAEPFRYGREQFVKEARTLAKFDHPNVVRVRNYFEANGTAYIVMDYYEGMPLEKCLQKNGAMPERKALQLIIPVLDGLREVHHGGFLHRDVKPQNVYLAKTRYGGVRPILLDFGAAREAVAARSVDVTAIITPGYAPIEQYDRRGQGPWTDVYAAGATLYRMLTGQTPLDAVSRIRHDDLERPDAVVNSISSMVSDAIMQALALYPQQRFRSIEDFQKVLLQHGPPP